MVALLRSMSRAVAPDARSRFALTAFAGLASSINNASLMAESAFWKVAEAVCELEAIFSSMIDPSMLLTPMSVSTNKIKRLTTRTAPFCFLVADLNKVCLFILMVPDIGVLSNVPQGNSGGYLPSQKTVSSTCGCKSGGIQ